MKALPMPAALTTPEAFISHWQKAEANERANSQSFLIGLAHILGVPAPSNNHADGYSFEFPVKVPGGSSTNFIDLHIPTAPLPPCAVRCCRNC